MNSELRAISCLKGQRSCPNQIQSIALHYLRSSNNQSDLPLCLRPVPPFSISSIHGNSTLDCDPSDLLDPSTALILHLLTPTLCLVLASWTFLHHYLARNNTPLRSVPGPWFASCSILYRFYFAVILGSWHHKSIALHKQYGPIVRITPTEVSVSDPAVIPEIYAHVDRAYPKCDMYDIALPNGYFNLAIERNIARHAIGRRAIAKDYTLAATLKNEVYFDRIIKDFITALDKNFASVGKICDFTIWSEYFTYDMITDLVFGKAFGFCKAGYDVKGGLRDLRQMLDLSPLLSYLPWIWPITKLEAIKSVGNAHYSTSTRAEISHRITHGNTGGRHDLLQGLLEARYPDGQALPLGEITNHAYIFILAAPDTASVALRKIVMNLAQHRDIHQQLLKELSVAKLSDPPTWKELEQIPLLSAVVKETIRLHPPAGFSLPRAVPEGGRTVCGKFLPGNTTVGISAWCAHHNEDFWGADASTFRPGRWLVKEEAARLERFTLSFGQGARACLGKHVAMMQLVKATAKIVQSFDFDVVEGDKIKEVFLLLVVVDGLKVMFRRRKGGPLDDTVGMQ